VPDDLLTGLDEHQRLRLGAAVCLVVDHGYDALPWILAEMAEHGSPLDDPAALQAVLDWLSDNLAHLDERQYAELSVLAATRICAQAVGWCTDEEILDEYARSSEVRAVVLLVTGRHQDAAAWFRQMDA
jgi:hypothetical protein